MNTDMTYCRDLVARHDRDRFILSLGAPEALRPALWAVLAFNHEIAKTREVTQGHLTGHIRLTWWRDALQEGKYSHEVLSALRPVIQQFGLPIPLFTALIDARMRDVDNTPPGDLDLYAASTNVPLLQLCAKILGSDDAVTKLGTAYGLTGLMRAMSFFIRAGNVVLPEDTLQALGVAPEQFSHLKPDARVNAFIEQTVQHARSLLNDVNPQNKFFRAQKKMTLLYLRSLERAGYNPFDARYNSPVPFLALRVLF